MAKSLHGRFLALAFVVAAAGLVGGRPAAAEAVAAVSPALAQLHLVEPVRRPPRLDRGTVELLWRRLAGHAAPAPDVLAAIAEAAAETGTDFGLLMALAWKESLFRPEARAATSSARGLYQFIDSTWDAAWRRHAEGLGLRAPPERVRELRHEPRTAALLAAAELQHNGRELARRLGRPVPQTESFLTHFLGLEGAERFLRALRETPMRDVREVVPAAFANNRARFPPLREGRVTVAAAHRHLLEIIETRRGLYVHLARLLVMSSLEELAEFGR